MANSTITAADNRLVFHYKIDEAAILFALPDIQAKNGVLHEEEFNQNKAAIVSLISSNVVLLMDGKPLTPVSSKSQLLNDSSLPLPVIDVEYTYDTNQFTNLTLEDHFPQLLEVAYSHYGTYRNGSVSQNFDLDKQQPAVSFSQSAPKEAVPEPAPKSRPSAWSFFVAGIEHIMTGFDHILFLISLLLYRQTPRQYISTLTAFTIAHSCTLILNILGFITLPSYIVESVIALSIVYVALENILFTRKINHRPLLAFGFGLIHGLGFASVLKEFLPENHVVLPLLMFNLGIEAFQIALVLCLYPILRIYFRQRWYPFSLKLISATICCIGLFWAFQRLFL